MKISVMWNWRELTN